MVLQDKMELMEVLAHAADISNPCKPGAPGDSQTEVTRDYRVWGLGSKDLGFRLLPECPNHNNVRVPRAFGDRSIHAQAIGTSVFQAETIITFSPFFRSERHLWPSQTPVETPECVGA